MGADRAHRKVAVTQVLALAGLVLLALPVAVFSYFQDLDRDRNQLLLGAAQRQGQVLAHAIADRLVTADPSDAPELQTLLARALPDGLGLRVLFRPDSLGPGAGFFVLAAAPQIPEQGLKAESEALGAVGILDALDAQCQGTGRPLAVRHKMQAQGAETLTSLTALTGSHGCWVLITSDRSLAVLSALDARPLWQRGAMVVAIGLYLGFAVLCVALLVWVKRRLDRFRHSAQTVEAQGQDAPSFAAVNDIRELDDVAASLDRMVARLSGAGQALRETAEDNAHAVKNVAAGIANAVNVLAGRVGDDPASKRAFGVIEAGLTRLDGLVGAVRAMDEAAAEALTGARTAIDLGEFVAAHIATRAQDLAARDVRLEALIKANPKIVGQQALLISVLDNLIDNAADFAGPQGGVTVRVFKTNAGAKITVSDTGPGAAPDDLPHLFERNYSRRTGSAALAGGTHFGLGLYLVHRNVQALGGTVVAENGPNGGLAVEVCLPDRKNSPF